MIGVLKVLAAKDVFEKPETVFLYAFSIESFSATKLWYHLGERKAEEDEPEGVFVRTKTGADWFVYCPLPEFEQALNLRPIDLTEAIQKEVTND